MRAAGWAVHVPDDSAPRICTTHGTVHTIPLLGAGWPPAQHALGPPCPGGPAVGEAAHTCGHRNEAHTRCQRRHLAVRGTPYLNGLHQCNPLTNATRRALMFVTSTVCSRDPRHDSRRTMSCSSCSQLCVTNDAIHQCSPHTNKQQLTGGPVVLVRPTPPIGPVPSCSRCSPRCPLWCRT